MSADRLDELGASKLGRPQYRIAAVPDGDDDNQWTVQLSVRPPGWLAGYASEYIVDTWTGPDLDELQGRVRMRIRTCEAMRVAELMRREEASS